MEDITAFIKTDDSENAEIKTEETAVITEDEKPTETTEETPKVETKRITLKATTNVTPPIYIRLLIPKTDDIYAIKNAVIMWIDYNTHCLYDYQIVEESEIDKKFYRAVRFPKDTNGNSFTIFVGRDSTEYINDYFDAVNYEILPFELTQKPRFKTKVRDFKLRDDDEIGDNEVEDKENTEEEKSPETDSKEDDNKTSEEENKKEETKEEIKEEKENKKRKKHRWLDFYDDDDDDEEDEDDEDEKDETADKRDRKKTRKKSLLFHGRSRS